MSVRGAAFLGIGAMVGPEAFFEVKYLAHAQQMEALDVIPEVAQRFAIDQAAHQAAVISTINFVPAGNP